MSWEEQINAVMKITTGDGKTYEVLHLPSSNTGSFEFNVSEFEFPEIEGTKVDRRLAKGVRYPLEFYFQGSDNIDVFNEFKISSKDTRPWVVFHPIFGSITGHPLSITFDNSGINTMKISATIVETIINDGPKTVLNPSDNAGATVAKARDTNNDFFNSAVAIQITDVTLMKSNVDTLYNQGAGSIGDTNIASEYFNLYNTAITKINVALNDFSTGVTFVQDFITYPAMFEQTVQDRLKVLKAQALKLSATLDNLNDKNKKTIFENQKGALITAVIETAITPFGSEYESSVDVVNVVEDVLGIYNLFISELQSLQSLNGLEVDSYLPNADFMFDLNYSMNYAVANLLEIAINAQQERVIYLESDSNVIIEAHRFYGLEPNDSTIERFINTNQIGMRELIGLNKGRKIVYYV